MTTTGATETVGGPPAHTRLIAPTATRAADMAEDC